MAYYSDQDDYNDDIPDFQDEAEFDDYLNDEEYDLINDTFPNLKKRMTEDNYIGWKNLDVKLALFDNDFDSEAAFSSLRKQFKKKKKQVEPSAPTTNSVSTKNITENLNELNIKANADDWLDEEEDEEEEEEEARRKAKKEKEEAAVKHYKKVTVPKKPRNPIDIPKYLEICKPHLSFVVLGHVDAGKSTLMGRLLYDIGAVETGKIRKLKKESESIGKGSFHLAWVMDQTAEERERGVTVSICTSDFETEKSNFTIVDAPGHRDFVPNAIAGVSQADVAVLSIDCGTDAFESGFDLDGQTKEHTILAKSMDVNFIIVAMNKMDSVNWSHERFNDIKQKLGSFFKDLGFREDQIKWVPLSGFSGAGVYKSPYPSEQDWYQGPNLVSTLEEVAHHVGTEAHKDVIDHPFLFSILELINSKKSDEAVVSGRGESGSIQPGEAITIYPSEQSVLVDKILTGREKVQTHIATKGDFVTLKLRQAFPEDIRSGDLGASVDYEISASENFKLQMLTFKMNRPLLPGTPIMLFRGVVEQPARINKLVAIIDKKDPSVIIKNKVRHLASNQAAIVEIELTERKRQIPMLRFDENKHLGRVVLRKDGRTIATGKVLDL